ncbi:unannotated protein [freshwater metagenome]|uniref:Unannotated protein n=1 Tax=freshwater metagenome TaxID=449393 RepID=A0A6J7DFA9_9ZZZZ
MSLFDFVEEHHREGLAANGFGQLTTFVVTHVARRGTDQTTHGVLLHVLTHIELDQRVFVIEQELGQGLGELRLTDTGGAEEDEGTGGTLGVLQSGTGATNRTAQSLHRFVLTHDALVEFVFHAQQLGGLFFGEAVDRNTGPHGQHFGNHLFVHDVEGLATGRRNFGVQFVLLGYELLLLGLQ